MIVLYDKTHKLHNPRYEYYDGERAVYAEQPDRIERIRSACLKCNLNVQVMNDPSSLPSIKKLHNEHYIKYLRDSHKKIQKNVQLMPSVFIKDTFTPLVKDTYMAALHSAQLALVAADKLTAGEDELIYALCRPPGHHAEADAMCGYCYFNNAALAAQSLSTKGRVAILDIDYHHGNGTQKAFYSRSDILYVSIHANPEEAFPYQTGFDNETGAGEGAGFNHNFPMPKSTTPQTYLKTLTKALEVIESYQPDYLVLSLGFDTYVDDPIAGLGLEVDTYYAISRQIRDSLDAPMLIIQEGGYSVSKLEDMARSFLQGLLAK